MSFKKKYKRPYHGNKLASITIRVTIDQKIKLRSKGNISQYIRDLLDECFSPYD